MLVLVNNEPEKKLAVNKKPSWAIMLSSIAAMLPNDSGFAVCGADLWRGRGGYLKNGKAAAFLIHQGTDA